MARRVSELVDVRIVQEAGDAPMAFLWRGRLYVVREVLGHWRERRDWWSTAAARALHGEEWPGDRPSSSEGPSFAVWSGQAAGSSGELPGGVPGSGSGSGAGGPGGVPAGGSGPSPEEHPARPGRSHASPAARGRHGATHRRSHSRAVAAGGVTGGAAGGRDRESHENDRGQGETGRPEVSPEFLLESECEVWRVEASTGRAFGSGVYDLSRTPASNPAADSWRLLQVAD
jgi:hypothetical protein